MHIIEKYFKKNGYDNLYAAVVGAISGIVGREYQTDSEKMKEIKETLEVLKRIEEMENAKYLCVSCRFNISGRCKQTEIDNAESRNISVCSDYAVKD